MYIYIAYLSIYLSIYLLTFRSSPNHHVALSKGRTGSGCLRAVIYNYLRVWAQPSRALARQGIEFLRKRYNKHLRTGWTRAWLDPTWLDPAQARADRFYCGTGQSTQQKSAFPGKRCKSGRGENVFGPHRRERIAVLAEVWEAPEPSPDSHRVGGQSLCKGLNI